MMLGDTNNRFSASRAVVVLASGLLVGLFLVALLSQMLARIDALDALTQMRLATTLQNLIMFMLPAVAGALSAVAEPRCASCGSTRRRRQWRWQALC